MNTVISIILFIIILIALYQMYYYVNPKLLIDDSVIQLNQSSQLSVVIPDDEDPTSIRYFYDGWLRVNQVQNNSKNLIIFNRGFKFVVSLIGHVLSINELTDVNKINSDGTWEDASATTITTISTNFPFQKWMHLCINVEGNQIDTYLDGKLATSVKGKDVKNTNDPTKTLDFTTYVGSDKTKTITIGNKYTTGSLARFRRETGNIDPQSVWNMYMLGPGVNDSGDDSNPEYHAKLALLRNGKPRRKLHLF
jgi:hypothetical protein